MNSKFHYLVRGVTMANGKLLVAKGHNADNCFLPGGHIESAEGAKSALVREIKEEIGLDVVAGQFLGALEHQWSGHNSDNSELNLLFAFDFVESNPEVVSQESHLQFFWVDINELATVNLKPTPLVELLPRLIDGSSDAAFWASTLE